MSCHICGQEAVDRCYTCGQLFCADHGDVNCTHCETGIAPGGNLADRISVARLRDETHGGRSPWWRAQQAEEYDPPACHVCQGLARRVCRNCEQHYCAEHAGPSHLCQSCGRSSLLGIWCLLGGLAIMGGIILSGTVFEDLGQQQKSWLGTVLMVGLAAVVVLAVYLVLGFSCRTLFRKAGKPGWIGFVPIWNLAVLLQLAGKPAWWVLLYFLSLLLFGVPIIVLQILLGLGLARNFGRSPEFGVGLGLLWIVFLPILALDNPVYQPLGRKEERIQ